MNISILTRKGVLTHEGFVDNKCRSSEWNTFHYEVKIIMDKSTDLDSDGFIVDHHLINKQIKEELEIRSCELVCDDIIDVVKVFLKEKELLKNVIAIKAQVKPEIPVPQDGAFFVKIWSNSKNKIVRQGDKLDQLVLLTNVASI